MIPKIISDQFEELKKFGINTPLRLAHFLAQVAHESGDFKHTEENLNYSAEGLKKIFPKYFLNDTALSYARQPEKIANRVYANRMGNGDEQSGDGWKFRGRGLIQLTGRNNYKEFDNFVNDNILENPDLVSGKYALISAAWFFNDNGINKVSDLGATDEVVRQVTRQVNGGLNGLPDRVEKFKEYYSNLK